MFGLTTLGLIHTAFALVALIAGVLMLLRHGRLGIDLRGGPTYTWCTVVTCLTGFGIFRHGGFNIAHVLGILTLVVLALAVLAGRGRFGRWAPYVHTAGFSTTLFFHMIPGINETFTRVPVGAPLFTGPDDPALQQVFGVVFLLYVIGTAVQLWRLHRSRATLAGAGLAT